MWWDWKVCEKEVVRGSGRDWVKREVVGMEEKNVFGWLGREVVGNGF